tara:strand:+ start:635 stop:793 length:159 start_codon:yes stop_codon:yes gene_type:complete
MNNHEHEQFNTASVSEKVIISAKKAINDINQTIFTELGCIGLEEEDYGTWSY